MKGLDIAGAVLMTVMVLGPLALAPAYGPYVAPATADQVDEATTPLEEGSNMDAGSGETAEPAPDAG